MLMTASPDSVPLETSQRGNRNAQDRVSARRVGGPKPRRAERRQLPDHASVRPWRLRQLGLCRPRCAAASRLHRTAGPRDGGRRANGATARRGHGHPRRARHRDRASERPRLRDVGQRQLGRDVRSHVIQDPRPHPRGGRRRRHHLRRGVEPRLHLQRRRAFVDGDRSRRRKARREHRAGRKAGVRRVSGRRQGLRESHRQRRSRGDRRASRSPSRAAGRPRRARIPSRWRSTSRISGCSADAAAA